MNIFLFILKLKSEIWKSECPIPLKYFTNCFFTLGRGISRIIEKSPFSLYLIVIIFLSLFWMLKHFVEILRIYFSFNVCFMFSRSLLTKSIDHICNISEINQILCLLVYIWQESELWYMFFSWFYNILSKSVFKTF